MTMANYVIMTLVAGCVILIVGAMLICLNHYFEVKRSNGLAHFITVDVKKMLDDYTDELMKKSVNLGIEMTNKLMKIGDDEEEG